MARRILKAIEFVVVVSFGLFVGFLWIGLIVAIVKAAI